MKTGTLVLIGVLVFAWTLLVHAPVSYIYAWLAPRAAMPVQLYGLDGSLGEGQAQSVMLDGRPLLQGLRWTLQPWWLPLLRAGFHVQGGSPGLGFAGRVVLRFGGIDLSGARLDGGIKPLLGMMGYPFLPVDGQARLDLDSLRLRQGFPQSAAGTLELHGLAWSLGRSPLPLGDFKAVISTEPAPAGTSGNGSIKAVITTLSGPLDASGEARLQADRSYDYSLQVKARDNADPSLRNLLDAMGRPDVHGYHQLRNRGRLPG